jgi:hypothetical protein
MGFNKKYLPPLMELKNRLAESPESIKYYWNADALIGPAESIDYIEHLWVEHQKNKLENQGSSTGET